MKTICRMLKRDSKGFTLVELMVVLIIIGILVAIAIPIYNSTQLKAKERACDANIRTIEGAAAQYYSSVGEWPSGKIDDEQHVLVTGGYLKSPPECPFDTDDEPSYYLVGENGTVSCSYTKCPNYVESIPDHGESSG